MTETLTEFGEWLLTTEIPAWQLGVIGAVCIMLIREVIAFMFRIDSVIMELRKIRKELEKLNKERG